MKLPHRILVLGSVACLITACDSNGSSSGTGGKTGSGGAGATGGRGGTTGTSGGGGTSTGGAGGTATGGAGGGAASGGEGGGTAAAGGAGGTTGGAGGGDVGGAAGGGAANGGRGGGVPATGGRGGTTGGAGGGGGATSTSGAGGAASAMMNFFVSSTTSATASLGGLVGADTRCQTLAASVGQGAKIWRAYLSAETPPTNAADRIGPGPYYNSQGVMIAADKAALHARAGDATLFLTEQGNKINGQWIGSPTPNEHDILTGTQRDGTLAAGLTCGDWTGTTGNSQVGHADGLGPSQGTTGSLSYWNSAHTGMCGNTQPGGGAGRIYCFVGTP